MTNGQVKTLMSEACRVKIRKAASANLTIRLWPVVPMWD